MVKSEWKIIGNQPLHSTLKRLKEPIKKWNKLDFGDIDRRVENMDNGIRKLDEVCDIHELSEVEIAWKKVLTAQLWQWLKRKERFWI